MITFTEITEITDGRERMNTVHGLDETEVAAVIDEMAMWHSRSTVARRAGRARKRLDAGDLHRAQSDIIWAARNISVPTF